MAGRIAERQDGVLSLAQLLGCGLTYDQIRALTAAGVLHRLHFGVYIFGVPAISSHGHLHGALLACGPTAFLSHRTAAGLLGLRPVNRHEIHVTVPGNHGRRRHALCLHRTRRSPERDELRTTRGLRHSSFARMLVEVAPEETETELTRLVEAGVQRGLFFIDKVERALDVHARRPGIARLQVPLACYVDRTDHASELERMFHVELARRPDIPPPDETNIRMEAGGVVWEVDCRWTAQRVVVELDGRAWHVLARDAEKDRIKDIKLATEGWLPLRVTYRRFREDAEGTFDDLRTVLAARTA